MKPGCYLGVDVGTTNTKAVVLREDGAPGEVLRATTPTTTQRGATFFDLRELERRVRGFLETLRSRYRVLGASFTSVGESVAPVRDGEPLADALAWYDPATEATERAFREEIERDLPLARRGCASHPIFSIYKILWTREVLGVPEPEAWLPIAGYLAYRLTGRPRWDFSLASRTMLLDAALGAWSATLLRRFDLAASLPPPEAMGTLLGTDEHGTAYAVGGHDHITGLYCVRALMGTTPFLLDSMGSSESVVALTRSIEPFSAGSVIGGVAFGRGDFYLLRGSRVSGTLLECLARLSGHPDVEAYFAATNQRIDESRDRLRDVIPMFVGGNLPVEAGPRALTLVNVPLDADAASLGHSAYTYLAAMARVSVEAVAAFSEPGAAVVMGGAATSNRLYMRYRATILGRPIHLLTVQETCGLGAALCAAASLEARSTIEAFAERQAPTVIEPGEGVVGDLAAQAERLLRALYSAARKP